MKTHFHRFIAFVVAGIISGCGGGGSESNTTPTPPKNLAPSIQNLQYSPKEATYNTILGNTTANLTATLEYSDSDGISDFESIAISVPGGQSTSLTRNQLVVSGSTISGTIPISIVQPATVNFTIRAADRAGNLSNELQGTFRTAYETTFLVTTSQNSAKTNFTIGWGQNQPYPTCARQVNTTFTFVSANRNGCGSIDRFIATLPDGTVTTWNTRAGATCPGGGSTVGAGSPIQIGGMFTWIDSTTNSEFTLTFPNVMDVHVNCT